MKKMLLVALLSAVCASFLAGCGKSSNGGYDVPTKNGGGGREQPYIPAGNKNGGQYVHFGK